MTTVDVMWYLKICRHCVANFHTRIGHTDNCLFYLRISDLPSVVWHQHDTCFVMSLYIFSIGFSSLCIINVYYLSTNICGLDDSLCIYIISPSCSHYYLSNHFGTSQMINDIFSFVKIMSSFLCLYQVRRVHSHIRGIDFTSFLDIDLGVCDCPDSVVFFCFHFIPRLWFTIEYAYTQEC